MLLGFPVIAVVVLLRSGKLPKSILRNLDLCLLSSTLAKEQACWTTPSQEKVRLLPVSCTANLNFIAFPLPVTGVIDCMFIARDSGYRLLRCKHCSCAHFSAFWGSFDHGFRVCRQHRLPAYPLIDRHGCN